MRLWRSTSLAASALRALALAGAMVVAAPGAAQAGPGKLDQALTSRANEVAGHSRVIVMLKPGVDPSQRIKELGGRLVRQLKIINAVAIELPNAQLRKLAEYSDIVSIHEDRPAVSQAGRTAITVGARDVQWSMGYTGAGIGVAVVDSGITAWHDDLMNLGSSSQVRSINGQRITASVDFVNGRTDRHDDYGHGTHVAGIIAGNGFDSLGLRAGVAPGAHLVNLKVLDDNGRGVISNVIAALQWAIENRAQHNIRVVNLSVGAAITGSFHTDPLTLAARQAVQAGLVVVTAAGNFGTTSDGATLYGGITAPANAPWVLTVGASDSKGTLYRTDDVMGRYSSRGPTLYDNAAKPDLVAPGTGIVSLSAPNSYLYATKPTYLVSGLWPTGSKPYLTLTGTSMAAPVVSGTVALMLQANPTLTPNLVKAILQYTAQQYNYDWLTQGAGFLNARGAVELARYFAQAQEGDPYPSSDIWSKQILWGNHRLMGGVITPDGNAWGQNIVWGTAFDAAGENIVWGTICGDEGACENIVWGTGIRSGENIVWGTARELGENIVWGTIRAGENIVWGTARDSENIVWGTACGRNDCENIVWGTMSLENIVWGTAMDLENIVWGTFAGENIVWGTIRGGGENIVWGTVDRFENIVWGTFDGENIVWGTAMDLENIVWGTNGLDGPLYDNPDGQTGDEQISWEELLQGASGAGTEPAVPEGAL